jgi:outer membrane protein assembly factor BamB
MKGVLGGCVLLLGVSCIWAQDWPQWRGPNRDARVTGFTAPKTWPKELTQKWKVTVGDGVATPALVGDKLYVFSREGGNEVIRCLDAASGKEVWMDKYESGGATGAASGFSGPRSSPTVAEGKVVTLGVRGILSCLDAASGKVVWRKDSKTWPKFHPSSSPIVVDGVCIAEMGGQGDGRIVAFDLANGEEKWKWTGDGPAYASPVLFNVDGTKAVVAEMDRSIVAVAIADGKQLWKTPFAVEGRGYNAANPIVDGATLIYSGSGRGTKAVKIEKKGGELEAKELWKNADTSVVFNTPVVKDGMVFGLSDKDTLFCIDKDGKTAWTAPVGGPPAGGRARPGYGSIVDAGSVLVALTPKAQLIFYQPTDKKFEQLAGYKVSDGGTYAYPIVAGNRIFIKDKDSVALWTIE